MSDETITLRPDLRWWLLMHSLLIIPFSMIVFIVKLLPSLNILALMATVGLLLFVGVSYLNFLYKKWVISAEQITIHSGFFLREKSYIELYRIYDYQERKSIIEIIVGVTNFSILSSDKSTPVLRINGIRDIDVIGELRKRVEIQKERKSIYELINN